MRVWVRVCLGRGDHTYKVARFGPMLKFSQRDILIRAKKNVSTKKNVMRNQPERSRRCGDGWRQWEGLGGREKKSRRNCG